MNIDWSKAPYWAEKVGKNPWQEMAWIGSCGYSYLMGNVRVIEWYNPRAFKRGDFEIIEARPSPTWTGEGRPPLGMCEAIFGDDDFRQVEIVGFHGSYAVFFNKHKKEDEPCFAAWPANRFRPIRTPEQVAADKRLHEIRNALTTIKAGQQQFPNDLVRGNIVAATVEAMIDAGYRKQPAP